MLFVLISWLYILFTLVNFGILTDVFLKLHSSNPFLKLLLGLFFLLTFTHLWAFVGGFGVFFHVLLLTFNCVISLFFYKRVLLTYKEGLSVFKRFTLHSKVLFIFIFLLILTKSASPGSLLDNETYYLQTIHWLNEYGFVKGLANLHLFFGQTSGWHVLQAAFNFHFLDIDFNDFASFILLIMNFYALQQLNLKTKSFNFLMLLPLFNVLLLEFTIVPSPDFGVFSLGLLMFYLFLKSYSRPTINSFYLLLLLFFAAFLVKVTALGLLVFPVISFIKLKRKPKTLWITSFVIISFFSVIWLAKNLIISGYPLYPSPFLNELFSSNYKVPRELFEFFLSKERLLEFFASSSVIESSSILDLIFEWLNYSKISLFFNILILLGVFLIPLYLKKSSSPASIWWIYVSFLIQIFFIAFTSPQYRFTLHYLMFFGLYGLAVNPLATRYNYSLLVGFQVVGFLFIIVPFSSSSLSEKSYEISSQTFQFKNIIVPASNSSLANDYELQKTGNMWYYSPVNPIYIWSNGDCRLPCVNKQQVEFLLNQTGFKPQLRDSTSLSRGFYSEKIKAE